MAGGVDGLVERAGLALLVGAHGLEAHEASALGVVHEVDDLGAQDHRRALGGQQAADAILDLSLIHI